MSQVVSNTASGRWAKIYHEDEGVIFQKQFDKWEDAILFVEGAQAMLEAIDDDCHGACIDLEPAKDEDPVATEQINTQETK